MANKFETNAIRLQTDKSQYREHSTPIFPTSSFSYNNAEQMRAMFADEEDGYIYTRFSNPNANEFADKMALLEGTEAAFPTASGMAAIFASFAALLKQGDHIVVCRSVFGSTHKVCNNVLPNMGIETTYVDVDKPETWEEHIQPNTKMIFAETPTNPTLDLIDLEWLGNLGKKHNIIVNLDNCFATPYIQQPAKFGIDLITHSATKFIDGQGRVVGGAVCGKKELVDKVYQFCRTTGPAISPFNAWILSKSLETLAVRMDRHSDNALALAKWLETNDEVEGVKYPFLPSHPQYDIAKKQMKTGGGVVTFYIKGGLERGVRFLDALKMASLTANLGDTRTIASHPASTTHNKLTEEDRLKSGITPNLIRISVGLEHIDDIIADVKTAIEESK